MKYMRRANYKKENKIPPTIIVIQYTAMIHSQV